VSTMCLSKEGRSDASRVAQVTDRRLPETPSGLRQLRQDGARAVSGVESAWNHNHTGGKPIINLWTSGGLYTHTFFSDPCSRG
jgi:hypothetical protein